MSSKTVPERIETLGKSYSLSQEEGPTLCIWYLLEAADEAEQIRVVIEEEIQQVRRNAEKAFHRMRDSKTSAGE